MYREKAQGWLKHIDFIILDLVVLQLSFIAAYMIRQGVGSPYNKEIYCNIAIMIELIDMILILVLNSYKNVIKRGFYREFVSTLQQTIGLVGTVTVYLFAIKEGHKYSRIIIFLMGGIYFVAGYISRLLLKQYVKRSMVYKKKERLLVVTESVLFEESMKGIDGNNLADFRLVGAALLDEDRAGEKIGDVDIVANKDSLIEFVSHAWIDEVFLNVTQNTEDVQELVKSFREMGLTLHVGVMPIVDEMGRHQKVGHIGNYTVVTNGVNYMSPLETVLKRGLDIIGGLTGCIITLVLTLILGPLIYIQSPGPIFFKQERIGRNGRRFYMYKFRSMYMDAEERKKELMEQNRIKDGMMFKLDWDPRIIGSKILPDGTTKKGLGNYIRDWSLDEFPQFFNVLKGDMSLVGTRPPTVDEWTKYEKHHRIRLAMKPGITGLWQVSGRSNITDFEKVVELDTQYIVNWDFSQDLKILFKTVKVVLGREGSM